MLGVKSISGVQWKAQSHRSLPWLHVGFAGKQLLQVWPLQPKQNTPSNSRACTLGAVKKTQ